VKIAPSILSADFTRLGEQIKEAEAAGADQIHIDVMDGRFVPPITFGLPIIEAARRATSLPLDVHLMIVEPEKHLHAMCEAGADALSIHVEATPHLHRALQEIRALGCRAGVAINPQTPAAALGEVIQLVDIFLVMTVNPGWGGQEFLRETLPKIRQLRQMANETGRDIDIGVDGGIYPHTAGDALAAGANVLIGGTSIFAAEEGISAAMTALRKAGE
jgi:ribulose-phosphate 3-epimerase